MEVFFLTLERYEMRYPPGRCTLKMDWIGQYKTRRYLFGTWELSVARR